MRNVALIVTFVFTSAVTAQTRLPVVLKLPDMEKVEVRKDLPYEDTLTFDFYRPAGARGVLPVVIFINGIGSTQLKNWAQYTTWPRLVAARGMAAITYQTSGDQSGKQTEALFKYISAHAPGLKIDPKRIALWACSANASVGTAIVAAHAPTHFRAAVFYYGMMSTAPKQPDLPVFVARAGLDALSINESIDRWVTQAVALEAPITAVSYPEGVHAFDLRNETEESRLIIRQTLDFLDFHLSHPPPGRTQPITPSQLTRKALQSVDEALAQVLELRKSHPKALVVQEESLNTLGYELMGAGKVAEAVKVFELMVRMYAASPNAFDSLGDAYAAAGRTEEAIGAAERAIKLLQMAPQEQREAIRISAEAKLARLKK